MKKFNFTLFFWTEKWLKSDWQLKLTDIWLTTDNWLIIDYGIDYADNDDVSQLSLLNCSMLKSDKFEGKFFLNKKLLLIIVDIVSDSDGTQIVVLSLSAWSDPHFVEL